jgi:hypothetical protein
MKEKEIIIESQVTGKFTILIDEEDWDKVKEHTWRVRQKPHTNYVRTNIPHPEGGFRNGRLNKDGSIGRWRRQTTLTLHRLIMDPPKGVHIDHINGNGLDNRKCNLRMCTKSDNAKNRKLNKNNTSGFKGVSPTISRKLPWVAQISGRYLGRFDDVIEAAKAYDEAAKELHGEFANLNFPEK